jgi:hypothetical protein
MTQPQQLEINKRVSIPLGELSFRATRSGGPGGQHVNTSSTRIELWWDLAASPSLDDDRNGESVALVWWMTAASCACSPAAAEARPRIAPR